MSNPRIEIAQILLKGFDDVAFPASLRNSLMDVITKSDNLSDDLVQWQDDVRQGRNGHTASEAALKLFENTAFMDRLNAVPHIETLARNFDEAMMSPGAVDLDGLMRQFDVNTSLTSNEMADITSKYADRVAAREQRVGQYMANNNLTRTQAEERFSSIYKIAVDRVEARRVAEAGGTSPTPPTNTAANAAENAAPNPNPTPSGTGAADNAADDIAENADEADNAATSNASDAADDAAENADEAENAANGTTPPAGRTPTPTPETTSNSFIPPAVSNAVSYVWNSKVMQPVRYYVDPVIKFASDAAITARYTPTNYLRRGISWRFNDHEATKWFFKRTDTYKTTNAARLSMDINAARAVRLDDAGNFVYKNGVTGVADDLTGAVNNVKSKLDEAHAGAQSAIDDLADNLQTASEEIKQAAEKLEQAGELSKQESLLNTQARRFENLTTNMDSGKKPDYDDLNEVLKVELDGATDPETIRMIQETITKLENTRQAGLTGSREHAEVTKVFSELSSGFSARADDAGVQVQTMTEQANQTIRRHQRAIVQQGEDGAALADLNTAAQNLDENISRISNNIADIEAPPPTNKADRLVGGSVTARLSAHKVKPHLEEVREFSDNLNEATRRIERSIDMDGLSNSFEDAYNGGATTKIDDLLRLSETLSNKSDVIRNAADLDGQLAKVDEAIESVRQMDEIAERYTVTTKSKHPSLFADGANTGMMIAQDVGRVEADVRAAHRREFRELYKNGDIKIDIPLDSEGKPLLTLNDVIRWDGNENVLNAHRGEGNDGIFMRSEPQKFLEYALVFSKDVDKALLNAEALLKNNDVNRFWEAVKWGSAGTFARNTDAAGNVTEDIARAPNQALLTRFYDQMREYSKAREANKGASAFTDRIERSFSDFKTSVDALGANTYRQTWRDMYIRTRNLRYKGDFNNELNFDVGMSALRKRLKAQGLTPEQIDEQIRVQSLDSENRGAKDWAEGKGATGRLGMRSYRRPFIVGPAQIWANLPYRKTHFDSWELTRQTLFEGGGLSKYVYPGLAVGAYAAYKGVSNWLTDRREEALVAGDIPQALDYSEDNFNTMTRYIEDMEEGYDDVINKLNDFEEEQIDDLDEKIAASTDAAERAKLQTLKTQITNVITGMKSDVESDRANNLAGLNQSLQEMEMYDNGMKGVPDLQSANDLLVEQQLLINTARNNIDAVLLARGAEIETMRNQVENAVENGTLLSEDLLADNMGAQLPVPSWVNPNGDTSSLPSNADVETPENGNTTGTPANGAAENDNTTTTQTNGTPENEGTTGATENENTTTTTTGTPENGQSTTVTAADGSTTTTQADGTTVVTQTNGATTTTSPTGAVTTTPPKPQWQLDLEKNQADAARALSRGDSFANSIDKLVSNPNAADGRKLGGTELMAVLAGQVKSLEDFQDELRNENDLQKAQGLDTIIQSASVNQQEAFDLLERIREINEQVTPLQERARVLQTEIKDMSTLADLGGSQTKLEELNRITSQIETHMKSAQELYDGIKAEGDENARMMNDHPDVRYRYGTAHKIDEALKTIGGGENGLPYQIFGRGESGVMSVAGGYASLAFNKVKEFGNWWGDAKRNASTQSERNWLNGIEAGAGIFGSLVAINMINKYAFGGNMPTAVKWGAILIAAAYFIHRTGKQGEGQAHARSGSSPFAQSNYGGATQSTNHTPANVNGSSTAGANNASASGTSQGTGNDTGATEVPVTDRNGNAVTHVIFENGNITSATVQSHSGGLPRSANDIVVSPEAAEQIKNDVQMRSEEIRSNILGRGGNVPDELRGNVDVLFNDKDGKLVQRVGVDFTVEGNPAELVDPAQSGK